MQRRSIRGSASPGTASCCLPQRPRAPAPHPHRRARVLDGGEQGHRRQHGGSVPRVRNNGPCFITRFRAVAALLVRPLPQQRGRAPSSAGPVSVPQEPRPGRSRGGAPPALPLHGRARAAARPHLQPGEAGDCLAGVASQLQFTAMLRRSCDLFPSEARSCLDIQSPELIYPQGGNTDGLIPMVDFVRSLSGAGAPPGQPPAAGGAAGSPLASAAPALAAPAPAQGVTQRAGGGDTAERDAAAEPAAQADGGPGRNGGSNVTEEELPRGHGTQRSGRGAATSPPERRASDGAVASPSHHHQHQHQQSRGGGPPPQAAQQSGFVTILTPGDGADSQRGGGGAAAISPGAHRKQILTLAST